MEKPIDGRTLRRKAGTVIAALAAAVGAGCAVGPDFRRPSPPGVEAYTREPVAATTGTVGAGGAAQRFTPGVRIAHRWWTAFGSPGLNSMVDQAFEHSPTVEAARAALRQARENTAAQYAAYFPIVQAGYSLSRQENAVGTLAPTLTSGDPQYTLHTAQLSISYMPDVFGLNRRAVESLAAQEETQRFQLEATYLTLASNVVSMAVQEAALRAQLSATTQIIEADSRALQLLKQQAEVGYASGLDVAAQETALAQAQQALAPLEKQLEQTRDLLAVLTGQFPAQANGERFELEMLKLPEELPLSLPSQLVERRPDVRAAEAQVHAASAQVGVAVANRLPQFSISATYGGTSTQFSRMFSDDNKFWSVTGTVAQTIFDFGALKHRQRAAQAAFDQTKAQYRSVVLIAFQNVADALYALSADARALSAAVTAEGAARKTLDLTRNQLETGAVNALALLNAEQAYQQSRIAHIEAQAARYTDSVALYQALGGGWNDQDLATGD
jgi:NodT family efflux transporter outer membrane factor (OMF) lipoprotein